MDSTNIAGLNYMPVSSTMVPSFYIKFPFNGQLDQIMMIYRKWGGWPKYDYMTFIKGGGVGENMTVDHNGGGGGLQTPNI